MDSPDQQAEILRQAPGVPWWRRLANRLWGYDFFVSYHWDSGGTYAVKLAEALRQRRFDCFLDRSEFAGGDDWKEQARQALANTQRLVVIGTREALTVSRPVHDEVALFTARSERVIPILFGERVPDDRRKDFPVLDLISNRVLEIIEDARSQFVGPSGDVLNKIEQAHSILRRRRLRSIVAAGLMVTLAVAATVSSISFLNAETQRRHAQAALVDSQRELARNLIDRGVRDAGNADPVGLLRLHRAYEIASRIGLAGNAEIPRDEQISRSARRLLAGWQASVGLTLLHQEELRRVTLSPNGRWVRTLTLNIDGEPTAYRFWDAQTGYPLDVRVPVDDEYFDLVMAPDWSVATHWNGSRLRRWDLRTGEVSVLKPPPDEDTLRGDSPAPVHSRDGRWAVKTGTGPVEIWDLEAGQPVRRVQPPAFEKTGEVHFSADSGTLMLVGGDRKHVAFLETDTRNAPVTPVAVNETIDRARLSDNGRSAALVLAGRSVVLINTLTGGIRAVTLPQEPHREVEFSPDGRTLLVRSDDRAWLVDVRSGTIRGELRQEGPIVLDVFSPDGRIVITTGGPAEKDRRSGPRSDIRAWDVGSAEPLTRFSRQADATDALDFSADGTLLLTTNLNGFEVYDTRTWRRRGGWNATAQRCAPAGTVDRYCRHAGFSADGRSVYTLSRLQRVARLVQTALPEPVLEHPDATSDAELSPDATRLLTVDRDGALRLWNLVNRTAVAGPFVPKKKIHKARFSSDGAWVIAETDFGQYQVWQADSGRPVDQAFEEPDRDDELVLGEAGTLARVQDDKMRILDFGTKRAGAVAAPSVTSGPFAVSRNSRLLATAGYGEDIRIWDLATSNRIYTLDPRGGRVEHTQELESVLTLAFSPDSTRLVAATSYGTVRIWDLTRGQLATEVSGAAGTIDRLCFSSDGGMIAGIRGDQIRLWDVATGMSVQDFVVSRARSLGFSADGRYLFVASPDATFRWRLPELPDQPERLDAWVDVLAVAKWSEQGSPTRMSLPAWMESWHRLNTLGGPHQ